MDYGTIVIRLYVLVWINGPYVAIFSHMWTRCGRCIILGQVPCNCIGCILGRVPRTKETLPDFR